jgi:hypothetical protein
MSLKPFSRLLKAIEVKINLVKFGCLFDFRGDQLNAVDGVYGRSE